MPSTIEQALIDLKEAEKAEDSAKALEIVKESLGKLSDADRKKLLVIPAVSQLLSDAEQRAKDSIAPGTTISDAQGRVIAKIPDTFAHMVEMAEANDDMIDWTPMQSRFLSIGGVDVQMVAGMRMRTPKVFYDVAMEAYNADLHFLDTVKALVQRNFGENGLVLHGDGTKA